MSNVWVMTAIDIAVLTERFSSNDDVGIFLRGHHLIEVAADGLCGRLYRDYSKLNHKSLPRHLAALEAIGFNHPLMAGARAIANRRNAFAHIPSFGLPPECAR